MLKWLQKKAFFRTDVRDKEEVNEDVEPERRGPQHVRHPEASADRHRAGNVDEQEHRQHIPRDLQQRVLFECFPYVCPEPVLA